MKNILNYNGITLYESILDDEDEAMDEIGTSMIEEWIKMYVKGQYKTIKLKNGSYKIWGNAYIKDCPDEVIPDGFKLAFIEGSLSIKNCGFKSLAGLFENEIKTLKTNINISNCSNLVDLTGLPWWIKGDLTISNCKSLKSLNGMPKYVEGDINLMKLGKRFKPDQIKEISKLTYNVFCSLDDNIENDIITEAVNDPHLYRLISQINKSGVKFKDLMRFKYNGFSWDQVTPEYITVYKEVNNKALTACRKILAGNESGLIATINSDNQYNYLFNNEKQVYKINKKDTSWVGGWSGRSRWLKVTTTEAIDMIKSEPQLIIISTPWNNTEDGSLEGLNAYKKLTARANAQQGVIPVGLTDEEYKEYYKKLAKENQDRYKKILAKLRAEKDEDIERFNKQVGDLLNRFVKFNSQVLSGKIKTIKSYELEMINKHFYGERVFAGYSKRNDPYIGADGLMTLYSKLGECFMEVKSGNNLNFYQKQLIELKDKLKRKIEFCDRKLKEYNI